MGLKREDTQSGKDEDRFVRLLFALEIPMAVKVLKERGKIRESRVIVHCCDLRPGSSIDRMRNIDELTYRHNGEIMTRSRRAPGGCLKAPCPASCCTKFLHDPRLSSHER